MVHFFGTETNLKVVFGSINLTKDEKNKASLILENLPLFQITLNSECHMAF